MTTQAGPRFRVFEDSVNYQPTKASTRPDQSSSWAPDTVETAYPVSQHYDSMSDVVTPGYHKIIASGGIVNNPMTRTTIKISCDRVGSYYNKSNAGNESRVLGPGSVTFRFLQSFVPPGPSTSVNVSNLQQQVAQAVLAGVDSTPYQFMEDVFEFHKTASFLRDPFSGAAELALKFNQRRRNLLRKGHDLVSATAGAWLTYRYALRPLVISITNALNEYNNGVLARKMGLNELGSFGSSRRTSRSFQSGHDRISGLYYSSPDPSNRAGFQRSKETTVEVHGGCLYEVRNPISSFAEVNGLRLKDLPPTLYNLIPYSWVLEHFVSVEKSIQGMINLADPNVNILAAWLTTDTHEVSSDQFVSRELTGHTATINGDIRVTDVRTVQRSPFLPSFSDALPVLTLSKSKDVGFITDMASLVVKRLKPPANIRR